jgi:putative ABC transport system substrate-binding protein
MNRSKEGRMAPKTIVFVVLALVLARVSLSEAQQLKKIGYLAPVFLCSQNVPSLEAFRQGLRKLGYVEGQNVRLNADLLRELLIVSRSLRPNSSA